MRLHPSRGAGRAATVTAALVLAGGLVACTVVDGTVSIAWTDDEFLT